MYMDDIEQVAKNDKEWETLMHALRIYNHNDKKEFGICQFSIC